MARTISKYLHYRSILFCCTLLQATWNPVLSEFSNIQLYLVTSIIAIFSLHKLVFLKIDFKSSNLSTFLVLSFFLYLFLSLASLLLNGLQPYTVGNMLRIASLYLVLVLYIGYPNDFHKLVNIYVLGSFFYCIFLDFGILREGVSLANRISPIGQGHANAFGAELALITLIRISYADLFSKKSNRFFYILILPVVLLTIIATFSRGALIGFILGCTLFFLQKTTTAFRLQTIFFLLVSSLILNLKTFDFSNIQFRYSFTNIFYSSGREIIFDNSFNAFASSPILGVGIGARLNPFSSGEASSHNLFLQILAESGLLGFITFIVAIIILFSRSHPRKSIPTLGCLFIVSFTDNHFLAVQFHVVLALIYLALIYDQRIFFRSGRLGER